MPSVSKSQRIHSQQKLCQVRAKCRAWTTASIGNSKSAKQKGFQIAVQKLATHRWHGWINSPKFHGFKKHPEFSNPRTIDMCFFLHKGSHQGKSSRKEDISATPPPRQRSRSRQSVCNLTSDCRCSRRSSNKIETTRPLKLNETKIDEFKPMNPICHKLLPIRIEYECRACDSWA